MIRLGLGLKLFTILLICNSVRTERKTQLYGENIPSNSLSPYVKKVQRRIVMLHDYYRTRVNPPASNMLRMKWHRGAARSAERWARQCKFLTHDPPTSRFIPNFGSCGQNIFVSNQKVPWIFVLQTWLLEGRNFTYGSNLNYLKEIGHYTQMVWATTHKIGCGLAKCSKGPNKKSYYNYICNYCPGGNHQNKLGFPYKVGKPCSSCTGSCLSEEIRLCTNSCNAVDLWANCDELYRSWSRWLCNDVTPEGIERRKNCRATCTCRGKIYD